jgi:hypothetical protein
MPRQVNSAFPRSHAGAWERGNNTIPMFMLRYISLKLLYVEAVLLMMVSIYLCTDLIFAIAFGLFVQAALERQIVLLLAFLAFVSFWNILLNVGQEKYANGKKVNQVVLILASLIPLLAIVSEVAHFPLIKLFELSQLGKYFLPIFLHMLLDIKRQQVENYRFKSISNQI